MTRIVERDESRIQFVRSFVSGGTQGSIRVIRVTLSRRSLGVGGSLVLKGLHFA